MDSHFRLGFSSLTAPRKQHTLVSPSPLAIPPTSLPNHHLTEPPVATKGRRKPRCGEYHFHQAPKTRKLPHAKQTKRPAFHTSAPPVLLHPGTGIDASLVIHIVAGTVGRNNFYDEFGRVFKIVILGKMNFPYSLTPHLPNWEIVSNYVLVHLFYYKIHDFEDRKPKNSQNQCPQNPFFGRKPIEQMLKHIILDYVPNWIV